MVEPLRSEVAADASARDGGAGTGISVSGTSGIDLATIPAGSLPGDTIEVVTSSGRKATVRVPDGGAAGDKLQLNMRLTRPTATERKETGRARRPRSRSKSRERNGSMPTKAVSQSAFLPTR